MPVHDATCGAVLRRMTNVLQQSKVATLKEFGYGG